MIERPILFSDPMVRALLDGRKTQTRRVVKPMPKWAERFPICKPEGMTAGHQIWWWDGELEFVGVAQDCPYGQPGDRLWVREAWAPVPATAYRHSEGVQQVINPDDPDMAAIFAAGWDRNIPKWKPSIHMPRWASRILLEITDVRVERLQDISEADAAAEGLMTWQGQDCDGDPRLDGRLYDFTAWGWEPPRHESDGWMTAYAAYRDLWNHINGASAWAANPWVWAVSFRVVDHRPDGAGA
ncbi:hypothetical protein ACFPIF_10390 [Brevundimonas faecalis]|uniref:hypothetical protein n=1 Tax=Brevundimonas faecalis TaxID=947378 RepID=UPI00360FEFFC